MSDVGRQMALNYAGSTVLNTTTPRTGNWHEILILEEAVFTTLTDASRDGDSIATKVFPAGVSIQGKFTAITLASGAAVAYKTP